MARNADKEFSMEIDKEFGDFIIEESGNSSINLRKVSWNGRPAKLDLRKWLYLEAGEERATKGVTLSDDGANTLTETLVDQGYGNTRKLVKALSKREDYNSTEDDSEDIINDDEEDGYYDPSELFGGGEEIE